MSIVEAALWAPARPYLVAKNAVCDAKSYVHRRLRDTLGQTGLEYFLIAGGIAVLVGVAIFAFGGALKSGIKQAQSCLNNTSNTAAGGTSTTTGVCS